MHWRIKGLAQKALGVVSGGDALHFGLQRRFGGLRDFRRELASKVEDWQIMLVHLRNAGVVVADSRFFEIGTGWYPTFPFALYLGGARHVITCDLNRHMSRELVAAAAIELGKFIEEIAAGSGSEVWQVRERQRALVESLAAGATIEDASGDAIRYLAPADATHTALQEGDIDVVFSNSVLEHVPPDVIAAMYRESMRILAPGGLMFHSVNCGDHYAYVDRSINQLNYLRYSDRAWSFWNNAYLYQNRMRAHELVELAAMHGFELLLDTSCARPERLRQLAAMTVHPQFAHIPAEKLCITSVDFIARKARSIAVTPPAHPTRTQSDDAAECEPG